MLFASVWMYWISHTIPHFQYLFVHIAVWKDALDLPSSLFSTIILSALRIAGSQRCDLLNDLSQTYRHDVLCQVVALLSRVNDKCLIRSDILLGRQESPGHLWAKATFDLNRAASRGFVEIKFRFLQFRTICGRFKIQL